MPCHDRAAAYPHGGIAFAASEVVCRLAVGIRGLLPHVNIPDKATDKHG